MKHDEIETQINDIYNEYKTQAKIKVKQTNKLIAEYNEQIHIINGICHDDVGPLIRRLHKFLSQLGYMKEELTPFDFETEKILQSSNVPDDLDNLKEDLNRKYRKTVEDQEKRKNRPVDYIAKGIILAGIEDLLNEKKANESALILEADIGALNIKARQSLDQMDQSLKMAEEVLKMSKYYRICIYSVVESIRNFILPELEVVRAFLLAESLKNIIIAEEDVTKFKPESISLLPNTIYHKHYLFVQNTFLFYTIITKFFSSPILSEFLDDSIITEDEKALLNNQIEAINSQSENVKTSIVFTEVT
jgi:hypothetical protein